MPNITTQEFPNPMMYDTRESGVVLDQVTGLAWQATASSDKKTLQDALAYCAGASTGGYHDWYLPSRIELVSIVDFSASPSIDLAVFPDATGDGVWSASPFASLDTLGYAWFNPFNENGHCALDVGNALTVRCVRRTRPGSTSFRATYQPVDSSSVKDDGTGLIWRLDIVQKSWADAGGYCSGLGTGWRLPTIKELQTLFDETFPHAGVCDSLAEGAAEIDATFKGTPGVPFWSSSKVAGFSRAWWLNFSDGAVDHEDISINGPHGVRCVR